MALSITYSVAMRSLTVAYSVVMLVLTVAYSVAMRVLTVAYSCVDLYRHCLNCMETSWMVSSCFETVLIHCSLLWNRRKGSYYYVLWLFHSIFSDVTKKMTEILTYPLTYFSDLVSLPYISIFNQNDEYVFDVPLTWPDDRESQAR